MTIFEIASVTGYLWVLRKYGMHEGKVVFSMLYSGLPIATFFDFALASEWLQCGHVLWAKVTFAQGMTPFLEQARVVLAPADLEVESGREASKR